MHAYSLPSNLLYLTTICYLLDQLAAVVGCKCKCMDRVVVSAAAEAAGRRRRPDWRGEGAARRAVTTMLELVGGRTSLFIHGRTM